MEGVQPLILHSLWIIPLVLLIFFLSSPRFRKDIAETRVRRLLAAGLEKSRYTILNDLIIPAGGGTIHLDHVVVSRHGVFVIESQYARGWISGTEVQDRWKQHRFRGIRLFDNPMHRNYLQREAIERLLKIPTAKVHPIVVMVGQKGFRTRMPEQVLEPENLVRYMRKKSGFQLEAEQAASVLQSIEASRIRPALESTVSKWTLLRVFLLMVLLGGIYLAFKDEITDLVSTLSEGRERQSSPGIFQPDGSRKSEQELWEDSLTCAYSPDTGRCACYAADGSKAELGSARCQSLAERGSILNQ